MAGPQRQRRLVFVGIGGRATVECHGLHVCAPPDSYSEKVQVAQWCPTLCDPTVCPRNSPGNRGVGYHSLLQGIFPTQGLNPGLLYCRQILLLGGGAFGR